MVKSDQNGFVSYILNTKSYESDYSSFISRKDNLRFESR